MPFHDLNARVAAMQPSATMAVSARAKALRREGRPIIELSAGEPDFDTPEPIREAGIRAIERGQTRYTANTGMPELREAVAGWLAERYQIRYEPNQIVASNGAKQSVAQALLAVVRDGDEVLIPAPYWVSYPEMVRLAGGEPVILPTSAEQGYRLTPDALDDAITERTRAIILTTPSNPTGSVYPRVELDALAEVLRRHEHVLVISDEIYSEVTYDTPHTALASLDGLFDRTVTVNGFSKAFAMTGWRLGYLAAPKWIVDAVDIVQSQLTSAPNTPAQVAGIAALTMDPEPVRQMVQAFRARRDFVIEVLEAIPGLVCPRPEGAFYAFPDVSAYLGRTGPDGQRIESASDLCLYLLEACDVALVPGEAFGAPSGARLSYAASEADLREALARITRGLASLS